MVSTGLGSTAWPKSVVTGGIALARAVHGLPVQQIYLSDHRVGGKAIDIREPFPVRTPQATLVYAEPLTLRSRVPDAGVIFSDGMEADFLRFHAGMEALIGIAEVPGRLVV